MNWGDYFNKNTRLSHLLGREDVQRSNGDVLREIYWMLENQKMPLLLYPHHVVLVTKMEIESAPYERLEIKLHVYDSEFSISKELEYTIKNDWSETIRKTPIYLISTRDNRIVRSCNN